MGSSASLARIFAKSDFRSQELGDCTGCVRGSVDESRRTSLRSMKFVVWVWTEGEGAVRCISKI